MITNKKISLAYSPCPNDTYIFHAIAHKLIDTKEFDFKITLADIETLNKNAEKKYFDVTKLSFGALGYLIQKYAILKTGAALGRGCGPLVIFKSLKEKIKTPNFKIVVPKIAVPGLGTTAYFLLRLYLKDFYPDVNPEFIPMPFENVMPYVIKGNADFGIIIHEARFVFDKIGLKCLVDLGKWWEDKTTLPIPLGCIAIKREFDPLTALKIESLIFQSIDYAFKNPNAGVDYIKEHAKELDNNVIKQHINLYVNDFSKNIGNQGKKAIKLFFKKSENAGLIPKINKSLFIH